MQTTRISQEKSPLPLQDMPAALESEHLITRVLPPFLHGWDLFVNKQVILLWLVNVGAAAGGTVSLLYWFVGGICFYLPTVIATAQLGVLYPGEGALYTWTYRAFAQTRRLNLSLFMSFLAGASFWIIGPLALVIGANAFLSFLQALLPAPWLNTYLAQPWQQGLLMVGLVLVSQGIISQRPVRVQKIITFTFASNLLAFVLIALTGVVWITSGHASATNFQDLTGWQPGNQNYGLFGLICLGYLGAPTAMTMSGELRPGTNHRRVVLRHLFWGGLLVVVCYHLATWALLVVMGQHTLDATANLNFTLVQVVAQVLGKPWATVTSVCLMNFVVISPIVYCLASSRLLMLGSLDQRLPHELSRTNRQQVPVRAFWVQTCVAMGMLSFIFFAAPLVTSLGQPATLASIVYNVVLATLTLLFMLATLFLFVNLMLVCLSRKPLLASHRILPQPLLWASSVLGIAACCVVIYDTISSSFIPSLLSNANWSLTVGMCVGFCIVLLVVCSVLASGEAASQRLMRLSKEQQEGL